ncbi:unnamed protein product [Symbiodinium sp. CCMP2456]|nr:unnamed protein product [Symbiodinium sp. CCMP2456]
MAVTLAELGSKQDVALALFHVVLWCRMLESEAAPQWPEHLVLAVLGVVMPILASAALNVPKDVIYSGAAFLALCYYDSFHRSSLGTSGSGLAELDFAMTSNTLLAEIMLMCSETRPSVLTAWVTTISIALLGRTNMRVESAMLVWCGLFMYYLSSPTSNSSQSKLEETESTHLQLSRCLGLVMRRIRVPLQLAQSDLDSSGPNHSERVRARLQQIWELLSGLDTELSREVEAKVARELCQKSDALSPLEDFKALNQDIVQREGSPESSTTLGSWTSNMEPGRWECLPEEISLKLTVDLERDSMPVTEVKLCMNEQVHLDDFLPSQSDWEEFRSWFEPEVNRAIHLDGYSPDSTAIPLVLPLLGDWHRFNAGKLQIALDPETDQHASRLIVDASQLTVYNTHRPAP